jgi:phosphatidylglycerophosphate synthase
LRLPSLPITWVRFDDEGAITSWSRQGAPILIGVDASAVVDRETVEALATASGAGTLRAAGGVLLWRCEAAALPPLVRASWALGCTLERAGSRATGAEARLLTAARPWDPPPGALCHRADDAPNRAAAARALFARLGRPGEGWLTRHVDRRISRALTRLLLPTTVTPNQVTLLSVAIGIGSGLLFATGNQPAAIAGALLFLFSTIVDGCDGELARLTFRESRMGERLDLVGDNVVHIVLFGGIAVGLHRQMPTSRITVLGTLLVAGVLLAMAAVSWSFLLRRATPAQRTLFETFASREFAYLLAILTVFGKLEWFLWIAAVGTYAFVAALLLLGTRETHG